MDTTTLDSGFLPQAYRLDKELGLNEMRERAGLKTKSIYENDQAIQQLKNIAGLK